MLRDYYWAFKLHWLKKLSRKLQYYGQKLSLYSIRIHFYVDDIENPSNYPPQQVSRSKAKLLIKDMRETLQPFAAAPAALKMNAKKSLKNKRSIKRK
jgi:hypothetical protein